jgi:glutaredoxin
MKATTKITRDRSTDEYQVQLFTNDKYIAGCDYLTDDEQDAHDTAVAATRHAVQWAWRNDIAYDDQELSERSSELSDYIRFKRGEVIAVPQN